MSEQEIIISALQRVYGNDNLIISQEIDGGTTVDVIPVGYGGIEIYFNANGQLEGLAR